MSSLINHNDRFFVAGGHGMAGSAICRSLKRQGYGNSGDLQLLTPSSCDLDLTNSNDVGQWFDSNKPDIVILAAAKVGGIGENSKYPVEFLMQNLKIQSNVIQAAFENSARRLLFLGSSCIYPKYAHQPIQEEELLNGALEPTNEGYALAKIAGVKMCEFYRKQYGFDCISLMPTNLYGPGDNYNLDSAHVFAALIRRFIEAKKYKSPNVCCWGSGSPLREFLHADDLGDACVLALEKWNPSEINAPKDKENKMLTYLNVGSNDEISIKDLAETIACELKYNGSIIWDNSKPDGMPRKLLSSDRFNKLGWQRRITLKQGIKQTLESILSSPSPPFSSNHLVNINTQGPL